jgi:predicted cupin superfamily sugar epimerase
VWFAAELLGDAGYALVGCTVAPGFDYADFELADGAALREQYPQHTALIERLT